MRKLFPGKLVLFCGLKQALGESSLQEIGDTWGTVEQELGQHGREAGPLQRL